MAEISLEEFTGGEAKPQKKELSFDAFTGKNPNEEFTETPLQAAAGVAFDKTLSGLKATGGEAAALADMVLSMPGFMIGVGGQLGGTIQAAARGVPLSADPRMLNPTTAYGVGREAGKEFSEPFMNPLKKLMDMFKSGEAYDHAKTTKGMEKLATAMETAGIWAEEKSGGRVSRDAVPMLAETLMASATGIGSGRAKPSIPAENMKLMREQIDRMRQEADHAAEPELSPEEFVMRVPVQKQINEMLGIRTPQEQAKVTRERRADVKQIFREPEEGGDYGSVEESEFRANERTKNSARFGQAEALEVLQKEPEQRSAADIAMLRMGQEAAQVKRAKDRVASDAGERVSMEEAMEIAQKPQEERSNVENTKLRQWAKQRGNVSTDALGLLAAAGIGATAGAVLDDDALRGAVLGGVSGLGPAMLMRGPGKIESRFKQAGAVKGPGGMWHPEAVERLADPLARHTRPLLNIQEMRAAGETRSAAELHREHEQTSPATAWSEKAIRNYLNKYAGTERDPLNSVEMPNGGTWGELMDLGVKKEKFEGAGKVGDLEVRPGETVFGLTSAHDMLTRGAQIPRESMRSVEHIQSYLSHVGDYLRQNVAADKLPQYDLVRAVRETAENDKRVAKQMEKAAGDSTKSLPVYKEYPDGFKWVELKLPEKLTEEQAKQVKREVIKADEELSGGPGDMPTHLNKGDVVYVAVDSSGKPVKNSYTDEIARAATPEEAWLAGRLAEEGNTMGHCVGGYCEGVASGESKIYSLRDSKGKSHVTIEVEPEGRSLGEPQRGVTGSGGKTEISSISQIKGKQNRAPTAEYLPYVQDFVKGGKWGEVGDLEHAGMVDTQLALRNNPALKPALEEKFAGQRYLKHDELDSLIPADPAFNRGPRGRQQGQISQDLVVGLTGLGLGGIAGWAMSDDPSGALLGALAGGSLGIPGARARLKAAADAADYGLGSLSTRMGNLSESVKLRARDYERRVLTESHAWLNKVVPFMQELKKVGGETGQALQRAILTNDKEAIAKLMQGNAPLVAAWRQTQTVLRDLGDQLQGHGRFKTMLDDYFPRLVKDVDGLKAALDVPQRTRLEEALIDGERAAMKNRGTPLTQVEQSSIINREIQGFRRAKGYQPGFAKQRGVEEITEKLQPFYHTPQESLYAYVRGAVQDLEMAKFFGKDLAQTKIGSQNHINVETSIGNLVGRELAEKKITKMQAEELIDMLQSRFKGGERASSRLVQEVRNLGNLGLLGNVVSAATQLGDVATAIYAQGLRPALTALVRQASGKEKISAADFGLADHIAEEFVSPTRTAKWLNTAFKLSGFSAIDRFGKTTNLNAALIKVEGLSRTNEGISKLSTQYGEAFGSDFPRLVSDLKAGRLTERVRSLLFSELSDVQPISKMEMPQGYLDNPNGRLIYMLKTFMLKQADMMRRDVWNEAKEGNYGTALKNGTSYALVLGLAGATTDMIKDWMLGRDPHFDKTDVLENVLKTFGWSEYTRAKAAQGKPVQAILTAMMPPFQMIDHIISLDPKAVQYIPLIGKLYYAWELGGKEASEIARKKKTGEEISEPAQEYRRQRRKPKQ